MAGAGIELFPGYQHYDVTRAGYQVSAAISGSVITRDVSRIDILNNYGCGIPDCGSTRSLWTWKRDRYATLSQTVVAPRAGPENQD
jgi:hypothetical protein